MRIKKILSLAVVLAMVLTVVPMFGLTASAEYTAPKNGDTIVYEGLKYKIVSDNLLTGGDFESGSISDWNSVGAQSAVQNNGGGAFSTEQVHSGTYSYKQTTNGGGTSGNNVYKEFTISDANEGDLYLFTFYRYGTTSGLTLTAGLSSKEGFTPETCADKDTDTDYVAIDTSCGGYTNNGHSHDNPDGTARSCNIADFEANTWDSKSVMLTAKSDTQYFKFYARWAGGQYFDDLQLYKVTAVGSDASVKVTCQDESGANIGEDEITGLYSGDEYTYVPEDVLSDAEHETYYKLDDGQNLTIDSLEANENPLTVKYTKMTFKDVAAPSVDETVTVDGNEYKVIGEENFVPNPSFETADGKFTMAAWYSAKDGSPYVKGGNEIAYKIGKGKYYYFTEDENSAAGTTNESYQPQHGEWSFGSRWNDGEDYDAANNGRGLCSIRNNFKVGNNKTMYLSFYTKATTGDDAVLTWSCSNSVTAGKAPTVQGRLQYDNTGEYKDWKKVEAIITTDAENDCVQFNAYWLGDGGNGKQPYFLFDEFVLVEVEESLSDVVVNYKDGDSIVATEGPLNTAVKTFVKSQYDLVNGMGDNKQNKYYVTSDVNVSVSDTAIDVPVTKLGNVYTVQNGKVWYNVENGDAITADKETIVNTGLNSFCAFNWNTGYDRIGIAVVDVPADADGYYIVADKNRDSVNDQTPEVSIWAISLEDYANLNVADSAAVNGSYGNRVAFYSGFNNRFTNVISLDANTLKNVAGENGKVVLIGSAAHTLFGLTGDMKIVAVPEAPTATLGWDEENGDFTINVAAAEPATGISITPAGGNEEKVEATSVAMSTDYTNREYTIFATVANGAVKSAEAAKASLYELVVAEVASGKYAAAVDAAKAAKASEVITMGGFIDENLDAIQQNIMTVSGKTYTIKPEIFKLGIGFKFVEGKVYVGSDPTEAATETDASDGVYNVLTVGENTVTLSKTEAGVSLEAVTLSIDSVNIEFVETLIEEAEANGADAAQDFIPEL